MKLFLVMFTAAVLIFSGDQAAVAGPCNPQQQQC